MNSNDKANSKMEFSPKDSKIFINIFNDNKKNILNFEGCKSIILLQDINNDNIFLHIVFGNLNIH